MVDIAGKLVSKIQDLDGEAAAVQRSSALPVENVKQHLGNLRPRYEEIKAWANTVKYDQQYLRTNWDQLLEKLEHLPVIKELGECIHRAPDSVNGTSKKGTDVGRTLKDYEDRKTSKDAFRVVTSSQKFVEQCDDLDNLFEDVAHDTFEVVENFGQGMALSDSDVGDQAGRLMEEVEVVAKKINADYEHILSLPNAETTLRDMSRTALLHTGNFLPALQQTHADIDQLLVGTAERKNKVVAAAARYMQKVATIESTIAQLKSQMAKLDVDHDEERAFETLDFVLKLPSTYGSLLVECVRRREWADKIKFESSALVEEVAIFRDEEINRRKKWAKTMEGAIDLTSIDDMAIGIDINVQSQKQKWPEVSRQDIQDFLGSLRAAGGFDEIITELDTLVKNLDAPTKQQTKRAKALKNGSIAATNFGKQSLLLHRDDDVVRSLESDKSKLEGQLKTAESRVKRLEDVLHRQAMTSRPPSSHAFMPGVGFTPERQTPSPAPHVHAPLPKPLDGTSRRSSVSSRKMATTNEFEDKASTRRIVELEGELAIMQQQAASKSKAEDDLKVQIQDAVSTKEDLLSNMEAQQREFDAERRLIEEENSKLRIKLEELEDDMDKMVESREQDLRVRRLEQELEKVRKDAAIEVEKAQGQVDFMASDYRMQREKAHNLETQVRNLDEEVADLSTRVQKRDMSAATNHRALRTVMLRLSKDSVAPQDLDSLVETIEELAKNTQEHLMEVEQALKIVRSDNASLESRLGSQSDETQDLREKFGAGEIEIFSLREDAAKHRTELASLQSELETERNEHSLLRSKFAADETDAESLRSLVAEKEETVADLNGRLAGLKVKIEGWERQEKLREKELTTLRDTVDDLRTTVDNRTADNQAQIEQRQSDMRDSQAAHDTLAKKLDSRSKQAEEISERLFVLKNSMGRLIEQVGYTVTKQDDALIFQRTPKATTSSTVLADPSNSMTRSVSIITPSKSFFDTTTASTSTDWLSTSPTSQPTSFANFIADISSLPPEAISEAIIKRVKEADHTTRKYIKEARAYRDKYRHSQSEAREKITIRAFKEGDLVLFLPTKNQANGAWAAFNVNYPHYFLREQDSHRLPGRDWLLARVSKIESRVVDLSKSINGLRASPSPNQQNNSVIDTASDGGASMDDENPFELSDGLRWYLMDATEEKYGVPMTIGSSKSTVAAANVDAQGKMGVNMNRKKGIEDGEGEATAKLRTSLDSRRSSSNSKAGVGVTGRPSTATSLEDRHAAAEAVTEAPGQQLQLQPQAAESTHPKRQSTLRHSTSQEQPVRTDLLFGP